MAYELKRANTINEELILGDETLTITLRPFDIMKAYQTTKAELIQSRDKLQAAGKVASQELMAAYGEAIVNHFAVIFGRENTEKILAFYEDNYSEMCVQVFPFIIDVLEPRIEAEIIAIRQQTRKSYKKAKYGAKWNLGDKLFKK